MIEFITQYWYFGSTVLLPTVWAIYSALSSHKRIVAENVKHDQGYPSLEGFRLPGPYNSDQSNALDCCVLSVAAYGDEELIHEIESTTTISIIPFSGDNSQGLLAIDSEARSLVVAIAGTNDLEDGHQDLATFKQTLRDWSASQGIPVAEDVIERNVKSKSGALAHTASAYRAIMAQLHEMELKLEDFASIYVTGHSLGGDVATLLQLTTAFSGSYCFTFGAPASFRLFSSQVDRIGWRISSVIDIVPRTPPWCRHAGFQRLYLLDDKTRRQYIPWLYLPLHAAHVVLAMMFRWLRRKSGHSAKVYWAWLLSFGY